MTRWSEHEVARRLAPDKDVQPPLDLLPRLLEDIPAEVVDLASARRHRNGADGPPAVHRQRWLRMAAVLVLTVGSAFLLWRVAPRLPTASESLHRESEAPPAAAAPVDPMEEHRGSGRVSQLGQLGAREGGPANEPRPDGSLPSASSSTERQTSGGQAGVSPSLRRELDSAGDPAAADGVAPDPFSAGDSAFAGAADRADDVANQSVDDEEDQRTYGYYEVEPFVPGLVPQEPVDLASAQMVPSVRRPEDKEESVPTFQDEAQSQTRVAAETAPATPSEELTEAMPRGTLKVTIDADRMPEGPHDRGGLRPDDVVMPPAGALAPPPPSAPEAEARTEAVRAAPKRAPAHGGEVRNRLRALGYSSGSPERGAELPAGPAAGERVFFRHYGVNPFVDTEVDRLSTFGLDVDTASWTLIRRYLADGQMPPAAAVRPEEVINYFDFGDPAPEGDDDFRVTAEGTPWPFAEGPSHVLLRFALSARPVTPRERKPVDLTLVVDTSGSMEDDDRLGLVRRSLDLLLDQLGPGDRVGLVAYGDRGRILSPLTADLEKVRRAAAGLVADGSTNAEEGLRLGYRVAHQGFRPGVSSRVVLASDGVANVGATGPGSILTAVGEAARKGIELTTLGVGMGTYNDVLMEQLADAGDGRYAYIDSLEEARRVLVQELTGTLETVAEEARVQVEFNSAAVESWRLVGYENRAIADEHFRHASVDAGEIGAGHRVTALYEVKLAGRTPGLELAQLRLRYRRPQGDEWVEQERSIRGSDIAIGWRQASPALRLAALAAQTAEILRGSFWARGEELPAVLDETLELVPAHFAGDPKAAELVAALRRATEIRPVRLYVD